MSDDEHEYDDENGKYGHLGGAPEGNDNAVTHGLYRDEDKLWKSLASSERRLVGDMSLELLDRYEDAHGRAPRSLDREAMRNILLDVIKRRRANEWMFSQDYIDFDEKHRHDVYSTILGDYYDELESLGIARDAESEKNRAEADFFAMQQDIPDADES